MSYRYIFEATLGVDVATYVEREADQKLYQCLRAGQFCYILNARKTGKSSLSVRVMSRLQQDGVSCVLIDLSARDTHQKHSDQWYADMLQELQDGLALDTDVVTWLEKHERLSPLGRFRLFLEEVVLKQCSEPIVILFDEIDSVLDLHFSTDDFFVFLRSCYNRRATCPEYQRLTFCLIGVATPSDLVDSLTRTPFNIGHPIELEPLELERAIPVLCQGLKLCFDNSHKALYEIFKWTNGQPFLTQKLCYLLVQTVQYGTYAKALEEGVNLAEWIAQLVKTHIIDDWELQDQPLHLRSIRDRLLQKEHYTSRLLGIYQKVLQQGTVEADKSREQIELRLSGLVLEHIDERVLRVYNRIYEQVFDETWIDKTLISLRPYAENFNAWIASDFCDNSRLLRGNALEEALAWKVGRSLGSKDERFLDVSQREEKAEIQRALAIEKRERELAMLEVRAVQESEKVSRELAAKTRQANQILRKAQQNSNQIIRLGSAISIAALITSAMLGILAYRNFRQTKADLTVVRLEQTSENARQKFKSDQLGALISAVQAAKKLKAIAKDGSSLIGESLKNYPTLVPMMTLQQVLDQIQERNRFPAHSKEIYSISFSPDGQQLATASEDGTARLWNLQGQQLVVFQEHKQEVRSVSFSPNGELLVTASEDGTARLWNLQGQQLVVFQGHQKGILNARFSPDGQFLATASKDGTARLWDLQGRQLVVFQENEDEVRDISFSPDGKLLATASKDGTASLWNLRGDLVNKFTEHEDQLRSIRFSHDGKQLATASDDNSVRLWNRQGRQLAKFVGHLDTVISLDFSSDGQLLASASYEGSVRLWNLRNNQFAKFKERKVPIRSVRFNPDGQFLATGSNDNIARLWNLQGNLEQEFKGHQDRVRGVSFSPDGQLLATASDDRTARLWNLQGDLRVEFIGHEDSVKDVSFSPDGQLLATASNDKTARLWNLQGDLLVKFIGHEDMIKDVSFSPNNQLLATASQDGTARLWNLQGEQLRVFEGHENEVKRLAFSPDGKLLATASKDCTAKLWNLEGEPIEEFIGHEGELRDVSFSPDGQLLATTSIDRTVKIWNLQGENLITLIGHERTVWSVDFSPNAQYIASSSDDGTVKLWKSLDTLLTESCNWLHDYLNNPNVDLSEEERILCNGIIPPVSDWTLDKKK